MKIIIDDLTRRINLGVHKPLTSEFEHLQIIGLINDLLYKNEIYAFVRLEK